MNVEAWKYAVPEPFSRWLEDSWRLIALTTELTSRA